VNKVDKLSLIHLFYLENMMIKLMTAFLLCLYVLTTGIFLGMMIASAGQPKIEIYPWVIPFILCLVSNFMFWLGYTSMSRD